MNKSIKTAVSFIAAAFMALSAQSHEMNVRVIQPPYAPGPSGTPASFDWLIDQLGRCGPALDLIVLPEFSDVPGRYKERDDYMECVNANNARLLEACAATAVRCGATLFVNAIDFVDEGIRNTTFAFDRNGKCVGKYYKRHVTAGERDHLGFDVSYTRDWAEPYILEIDGIRYAFLTCYDFYYYEMLGPIGLQKPDIVIGCSLQRSDKHEALEFINQFCAYNTGAYLVRSSVSMGKEATVGGSSMVVAPTGEILGNMKSRTGSLDVTIDPAVKYLKPAGFGNPPATHPEYMEIGRRPWLYRPGGSAIVLPLAEAPTARICASGGMKRLIRRSPLAAIGAAIALDADEIGLELRVSPEGTILHGNCTLESILRKFSCHTIMSLRLCGNGWDEKSLTCLARLIFAFDAGNHVYVSSPDRTVLSIFNGISPSVQRCLEGSVQDAADAGCQMVLPEEINPELIAKAHDAGLRCIARGRRRSADKLFALGSDTVIISDFK